MKLLLVDGSALLHRAYHAYPPLTAKNGTVVGAVYGVVSMLTAALEEVAPSHVVVAWDLPQPTFRHERYVGYKAQRPKADAEMVEQIPVVKELIASMGVVQLEQAGYEADDIIGTLAQSANSGEWARGGEDVKVIILTGDQDTMQLVTEKVGVLTPPKGKTPAKLYGVEEVFEKYGVKPEQIVDYKALVGDPSDNIPGVAGIGPKTAAQLLRMFGSLARIYRDINEVQNHFGEKVAIKLMDGKESAYLSQELSQILREMKLAIELPHLEYRGLVIESFKTKLGELGFKSLIRRIWGEELDNSTKSKEKSNENQLGLF